MRSIRPPREVSPDASRPWLCAALPLAGLLTTGLVAISLSTAGRPLDAAPSDPGDADGDGLADIQEFIQQTSPFLADTDGDGFGDAEEMARGSSPFLASQVPLPGAQGLSLTARGEGDHVTVMMAAYVADGRLREKAFDFGILTRNGTMAQLPPQHVLATGRLEVQPALSGSGRVALVEFQIDPDPVLALKQLTIFATMSTAGSGVVEAAAAVDLFVSSDGVLMKSGPSYAAQAQGGTSGGGILYQPIPPSEDLPAGWQPGNICHQRTVAVGYEGGVVLTRVVGAECEEGWNSYCSPAECKASVGDEYSTIDPVGLVGG